MHLTKSEQQIMGIFWKADHPMAQTEVVSTCVDRKWKERSIFSMLNSLMEKGVLKESGFVRSGKTYARTFEPAMSHAEYLAVLLAAQRGRYAGTAEGTARRPAGNLSLILKNAHRLQAMGVFK